MVYARRYSSRRSRSGRGYVPPRVPIWVRNIHQHTFLAQGDNDYAYPLVPSTAIDPGARTGSTVMRIRGDFTVTQGSASGEPTGAGFYIGVAVVSTSGLPEAGTELPTFLPGGMENNVGWMFWRRYAIADINVGGLQTQAESTFHVDVDVKAKRRISQPGENLYLFYQTAGMLNVASLLVSTSTLLKLS